MYNYNKVIIIQINYGLALIEAVLAIAGPRITHLFISAAITIIFPAFISFTITKKFSIVSDTINSLNPKVRSVCEDENGKYTMERPKLWGKTFEN